MLIFLGFMKSKYSESGDWGEDTPPSRFFFWGTERGRGGYKNLLGGGIFPQSPIPMLTILAIQENGFQ